MDYNRPSVGQLQSNFLCNTHMSFVNQWWIVLTPGSWTFIAAWVRLIYMHLYKVWIMSYPCHLCFMERLVHRKQGNFPRLQGESAKALRQHAVTGWGIRRHKFQSSHYLYPRERSWATHFPFWVLVSPFMEGLCWTTSKNIYLSWSMGLENKARSYFMPVKARNWLSQWHIPRILKL